jgi:hypothetical protein
MYIQVYGAPDTIRTCDHLVRSQVLYPAELRALNLITNCHNAISDVTLYGGERGIRTLDRDEPIHTFQACAFGRSASSPDLSCKILR